MNIVQQDRFTDKRRSARAGRRWPDAGQVDLIWHLRRHDTTIRPTRTPAELGQVREDTIPLIDGIESRQAEADFPTSESGLCGWASLKECVQPAGIGSRRHRYRPTASSTNLPWR